MSIEGDRTGIGSNKKENVPAAEAIHAAGTNSRRSFLYGAAATLAGTLTERLANRGATSDTTPPLKNEPTVSKHEGKRQDPFSKKLLDSMEMGESRVLESVGAILGYRSEELEKKIAAGSELEEKRNHPSAGSELKELLKWEIDNNREEQESIRKIIEKLKNAIRPYVDKNKQTPRIPNPAQINPLKRIL